MKARKPPKAGSQITAARAMIRALDVEAEHEALKEIVLGLARAVDKDPEKAALWREYREAVTELREATTNSDDDETATFLDSIRTPTPRVRPKVVNS